MNKKLLLVLALGVIAAGAYMYLRNKRAMANAQPATAEVDVTADGMLGAGNPMGASAAGGTALPTVPAAVGIPTEQGIQATTQLVNNEPGIGPEMPTAN